MSGLAILKESERFRALPVARLFLHRRRVPSQGQLFWGGADRNSVSPCCWRAWQLFWSPSPNHGGDRYRFHWERQRIREGEKLYTKLLKFYPRRAAVVGSLEHDPNHPLLIPIHSATSPMPSERLGLAGSGDDSGSSGDEDSGRLDW